MNSEGPKQNGKEADREKKEKKKPYSSPRITYEEDVREVVQSGGRTVRDFLGPRRRRL